MSECTGSERRLTDTENTDNVHVSASLLDAETVQNSLNVRSCHVEEGTLRDSDLLKGMLTDTFCQVCEAVLRFDSQRVSHYEGKKHAQRVRIYLQTLKAERSKKKQDHKNILSTKDPEKFCELCNMVFSSPLVAKSHYEGKVHAKNTRKTGGTFVDSKTTCPLVVPVPTEEGTKQEVVVHEQKESAAVQGVDLSDPDKYCKLCTASFNNPVMAQQHYSGRKHQRNRTRQQMLDQLSEKFEHASSLTCPLCCVTLESVEVFQDHMQGNKHYAKEKKVTGLCKKKMYDSFQEELADYIQVQKARGLEPKLPQVSEVQGQWNADEQESESDEYEEENQVTSNPSHLPHPAFGPQPWHPPFHPQPNQTTFRIRFPSHQQLVQGGSTYPPPLIPGLTGRSLRKWKRQNCSSSSSVSDSSTSSYSSSSSDSSSGDGRRRRKRKRREGTKRKREVDDSIEDVERRRRKKRRTREGHRGRRRGESSEKERRKRQEVKRHKESKEREGYGKKGRDDEEWCNANEEMSKGDESVVQEGREEEAMFESTEPRLEKPKHRKDRKKTKDPEDKRTEEEKLWDETILGIF